MQNPTQSITECLVIHTKGIIDDLPNSSLSGINIKANTECDRNIYIYIYIEREREGGEGEITANAEKVEEGFPGTR